MNMHPLTMEKGATLATGSAPKSASVHAAAPVRPKKVFDELQFADNVDGALNDARGVLRTVIDALSDDEDQHHHQRALILAEDRLDVLRDLMDEWDEKSRKPRAMAAQAERMAARKAIPCEPMDLATIARLKAEIRKDEAEHARRAKAKH